MPIGEHDGAGGAEVRIVLGLGAGDGDLVALLDGVPGPAVADEDVGAGELEIPVGHFAAGVGDVHVEVRVGIGPLDFGDDAGEVDLLVRVELGGAGVVGEQRQR